MALVDQWKVINGNLAEGWTSVQLRLTVEEQPETRRGDARARERRPAWERRHLRSRSQRRRVIAGSHQPDCLRGWTPSGFTAFSRR